MIAVVSNSGMAKKSIVIVNFNDNNNSNSNVNDSNVDAQSVDFVNSNSVDDSNNESISDNDDGIFEDIPPPENFRSVISGVCKCGKTLLIKNTKKLIDYIYHWSYW